MARGRARAFFSPDFPVTLGQGRSPISPVDDPSVSGLPGPDGYRPRPVAYICFQAVLRTVLHLSAVRRTDAYLWLKENSWKFGFVLRYPEGKEDITGNLPEPWHFRYVGRHHAAEMYRSGLCLEEYIDSLTS